MPVEVKQKSNVRIDVRVPCASECPCLVSGVLCQFQEPDSSMILGWLMCISGITKAVTFWYTD